MTTLRLVIGAIILGIVLTFYSLLYTEQVRAMEVLSGSMEPTIQVGDRLLVKAWDPAKPVQRGEIVIIESPDDEGPNLVKRVVGMPGDKISMRHGVLLLNSEPALVNGQMGMHPGIADFDLVVPEGTYYLLGDNRARSHDSTEFGPVPASLMRGRVWYRYGPWARRGTVE